MAEAEEKEDHYYNHQTLKSKQNQHKQLKYQPPEHTQCQRHEIQPQEHTQDQRYEIQPPELTKDQRYEIQPPDHTQDQRYEIQPPEHTQDQRYEIQPPGQTRDQRHEYPPLKSEQREKLEEFFKHNISNATVNYTNPEIQDIQTAMDTMLERLRTRVNSRGIFNISRIVHSGSMAEKTSLWKYRKCIAKSPGEEEQNSSRYFMELDNLAVLENAIKQCEDITTRCRGCIKIVNAPVDLERLAQFYLIEDRFNAESLKDIYVISELFLNEINDCLASSCDCLSLQSNEKNISFRPLSVEHKGGCGECTVVMPTGTLRVNTSVAVEKFSSDPNNCSLIFLWTSKAKTLSAPCPMLLQKPQPISSLPIYVDFLPTLESLQPTAGAEDEHDFFIVPKHCIVWCYDDRYQKWRKSCCMDEINAFTTKMSEKHKICYKIMKYFAETMLPPSCFMTNYHIKTAVLRHHTTCVDTTDDCVDCVMVIYRDLQHAYQTQELLSYQSNLNIFNKSASFIIDASVDAKRRCEGFIHSLCSVAISDTWESFIRKILRIFKQHRDISADPAYEYIWD